MNPRVKAALWATVAGLSLAAILAACWARYALTRPVENGLTEDEECETDDAQ